jgi:hypothetical protein
MQRQVAGAPEYQGIDANLGWPDVPCERRRPEIADERELRAHRRARELG